MSPLLISLKVALCSTILILPPGIALGYLLARVRFRGRSVIETLASLPLVLPPTAVGYVLLRALGRHGPFGAATLGIDLDILFTWKGAVLAACVMALPLVVRSARVAFEEVDPRLEGVARTLGLGPARTFATITLPLARRGLLASCILGFSRSLGEFGATIMVAGSIPGRTETLALAIWGDMQTGRDRDAMLLVGLTIVLAFAAIWTVEILQGRRGRRA